MKKAGKKTRRFVALALSAVMLVPGTVTADEPDALEELEAVMERYEELSREASLTRYLGLDELCDAIEDNGLTLEIDGRLSEPTLRTLGLSGELPDDAHVSLRTQVDPKQKNWLFYGLAGTAGEEYDLEIYGDRSQLALSIPVLYAGAAAVRSGSFNAQFEGSALQTLFEITEEIPDFDLIFYPEKEDFRFITEQKERFQKTIEETLEQAVRVERADADGKVVYTAYMQTEALMNLSIAIIEQYFELFEAAGLVTSYDVDTAMQELYTAPVLASDLMGEEIAVEFQTADGLLEKISCELYMDPTQLETEELQTEAVDVTEDAAIDVSVDVAAEEPIYMTGEMIFEDPAQPAQGFVYHIAAADEQNNELMKANFTVKTETTESGTGERTTFSMDIVDEGTGIYSGDLAWMEYDPATGDLDAWMGVEEEGTSVAFVLDSTITKETGRTSWQIDDLSMVADGESIGVMGTISIAADPGVIEAPQNPKYLFELDNAALMGFLTEIMYNAEALTTEETAEPETEYVVEDITTGYDSAAEQELTVEDAESVSVIGGADGPTSVFIAGKVS